VLMDALESRQRLRKLIAWRELNGGDRVNLFGIAGLTWGDRMRKLADPATPGNDRLLDLARKLPSMCWGTRVRLPRKTARATGFCWSAATATNRHSCIRSSVLPG